MYQNGTQQENVDYPKIEGWPERFVPVSIHSDKSEIDYVSCI